jgi:hypothetical protein
MVRLNDEEDEERTNLQRCLKFIENLLEEEPINTSNKLMHVDPFIDWLLIFLERGNPSSENFV